MAEREQEERVSNQQSAGGADAATTPADEPNLRAMLDEARREADQQRGTAEEHLHLLQRVQADFVNYKRRVEAEREAQAEAVRAETIRAFLPIVDDLERALAHVPPEAAGESWVEGFRLIERGLGALLERLGVRRIGAEARSSIRTFTRPWRTRSIRPSRRGTSRPWRGPATSWASGWSVRPRCRWRGRPLGVTSMRPAGGRATRAAAPRATVASSRAISTNRATSSAPDFRLNRQRRNSNGESAGN